MADTHSQSYEMIDNDEIPVQESEGRKVARESRELGS
jgi:hypothetical protein